MNGTNTPITVSGPSTLVRARFGPGMLLKDDDLEQLNVYTRELSRLLFRSFFGCGVVCGLKVTPPKEDCGNLVITVASGLALDCAGDPIYVPADQKIVIDENCERQIKGPLYVILCGFTKCCAPRPPRCPSDDDEPPPVSTRERDYFKICVVRPERRPKCVCGRRAEEETYRGECDCGVGDQCHCHCSCVLLAELEKKPGYDWDADHSVRRFIRPALMDDPLATPEEEEVPPHVGAHAAAAPAAAPAAAAAAPAAAEPAAAAAEAAPPAEAPAAADAAAAEAADQAQGGAAPAKGKRSRQT